MIWTVDSQIKAWLPKLQAHRGYWVEGLRQNSLESIKTSYEMGYAMAEFDVRCTSDAELILYHDDVFEGEPVIETSLSSLKSRISITTLEELFVWFSATGDFKLNLEIKSKALLSNGVEEKICELISRYSLQKRILISSFNPLCLFRVRRLDSRIYRALLLTFKKEDGNNWIVTSMILNLLCRPHALHLRYEDFSLAFKSIATKVPVVLWTVNDLGIYEKYKDEIHGVISDDITPQVFKPSRIKN